MQAELRVGAPGSFVVSVDGEVVVEKKALGFPEDAQIVEAVRRKLGR